MEADDHEREAGIRPGTNAGAEEGGVDPGRPADPGSDPRAFPLIKIPGYMVVGFVLKGLKQDREKLEAMGGGNEKAAELHDLAEQGRVSVKLYVPAADDLEEEDFALFFEVQE